jgi:hypothetical protein
MSRDGFARGIGRWTPGNIVSDKSGNLVNTATGEAVEPPWQREQVAKAGAGKPPVEEPAEGGGDAGGTEPTRVPGATDIAARLAEIRALRRTDEKRYWSNEIQDEELALIRASAEAEPAGSAAEESAEEGEASLDADAELAEVQAELATLKAARKASRTGALSAEQERRELELLSRQEVLQAGAEGLAPELIERWRASGLAANMERAVGIAARAGESAFAEIAAAVDNLPDGMSVEIVDQLRLDWPAVRGSEEHRRDVAAARLDTIIGAVERQHGVRAGAQVEDAIAKLSPAARAGIVRMLAGG